MPTVRAIVCQPRPEANEIIEGAEQGLHHGDVDFDLTGRFDPIKCWFYKKVLAELYPNGTPAGSWLDIGCGHGELLATVNSLYHDAVAIRGRNPMFTSKRRHKTAV